jgi:DNA-binding response OmpR family regulator
VSGSTILVADDSPVYHKLVEQALSQNACTVCFVNTGREAIEIFERLHPAIVITDWVMPDLTGIELCHKIRADVHAAYTYIIILTSNAEKENVVKGLSAGADDYLTKPFHRDELLARVRVGERLIELQRQIESPGRGILGPSSFERRRTPRLSLLGCSDGPRSLQECQRQVWP